MQRATGVEFRIALGRQLGSAINASVPHLIPVNELVRRGFICGRRQVLLVSYRDHRRLTLVVAGSLAMPT